jgi:bifunctional non-homologous end joining protein LigD
VSEGIAAGRLEFELHGRRLKGRFALIKMKGRGKDNWLLIKMKDEYAQADRAAGNGAANGATNGTAKGAANGSARRTTAARARTPKAKVRRPPKAAGRSGRRKADDSGDGSGSALTFTHTDKVMYPEAGLTKGYVLDFYRRIAPRLLPYLQDRPCTLERLPEGVGSPDAPHFWQKHTPAYYPDWVPRVELPSERGRPVSYVLVNDERTLLYLVNQGTLTFHVWFSRVQDLDRPDFVLFDLDPGEAAFADVVEVARELHRLLQAEKAPAFVKTSGKTGLHVLTPWAMDGDHEAARTWAMGLAERLVDALPQRATVERSKAGRHGRVYVDVMQNARGHHAVPPYVLRATPTATVSTPLRWEELTGGLSPKDFTAQTIFRRLSRQRTDPFAPLLRVPSRRKTNAGA